MIYFDNAATTFPKPDCVKEAINVGFDKYNFNAGRGSYKESYDTYKMIEDTRRLVGDLGHSSFSNVVFTSSATEASNIILYGLSLKENDYVYISPFEHNAIVRTLSNIGIKYKIIPFIKETWKVDYEQLNNMFLLYKPSVVLLSQVSNVTGFVLPYEEIFSLSRKYGALNILDSAQSFGILDVNNDNVDFLIFAGHKSLYAVYGVAGFINYNNFNLKCVKVGGTGSDSLNPNMPSNMPYKYEAGSYNSLAIYALHSSIEFLMKKEYYKNVDILSEYLITKLAEQDNIIIYLPQDYISHGIVSFNVMGYLSDEIGEILSNDYDICVRTGYHCSPLVHDFINSKEYNGTVRVSIGIFNTKNDIDILIEALKNL